MTVDREAVSAIVKELEAAWNAADGARFAVPFTEDADFVNIRGEHFRTREVIARGHQAIFDTLYKGSTVRNELAALRPIAPGVLLAHVKAVLNVPTGPLTGKLNSQISMVLVQQQGNWLIAAFHNTLVKS